MCPVVETVLPGRPACGDFVRQGRREPPAFCGSETRFRSSLRIHQLVSQPADKVK